MTKVVKRIKRYNLEEINPSLARQWHPTKNGSLIPRDVLSKSRKRVWWVCDKGHEWVSAISNRSNGSGCPYCSGRKVCSDNCLETVNPDIAKQWHPAKNGTLSPKDVTLWSNKTVWWICDRGHAWKTSINSRSRGTGCPYCAGQKVCADNCLQTVNPGLARQWHPDMNGLLTPRDVTPGSGKRVWWLCEKGHEWQAPIANRNFGDGCPYCSGKAVCQDNCLQANNPVLAQEWHPTKNGTLSPRDVFPNSHKKVWWICERTHEWKASVNERNQGNSCPYCSRRPLKKILKEGKRISGKAQAGSILVEITPYELEKLIKYVCIIEDLGSEIVKFRKERGLSQKAFGIKAGISRNKISEIERSNTYNITLRTYQRIVDTILGER